MRYLLFITIVCLTFLGCKRDTKTSGTSAETESKTEKVGEMIPEEDFDWQAHRGGRGLMPENSIAAFLSMLDYTEITTMELDLCVSKDRFLVVSHEPWMSAAICNTPDGKPISADKEEKYNLYQIKYIDITEYDCGSRGNERFPEQKKLRVGKPRLGDVVSIVDRMATNKKRKAVRYNIEIKSSPEGDKIFHPEPYDFAKLVLDEIEYLNIKNRVTIQSFDPRPLQELQKLDPSIELALLVENEDGIEANINKLGFTPQIYSPYHKLLTEAVVKDLHSKSMKVIPWTVNEIDRMKALIAMGVDGIITDYPNRIGKMMVE